MIQNGYDWPREFKNDQGAARPQNTSHFSQSAKRIFQIAQTERDRQRIERCISKWQTKCVGFHVPDREFRKLCARTRKHRMAKIRRDNVTTQTPAQSQGEISSPAAQVEAQVPRRRFSQLFD